MKARRRSAVVKKRTKQGRSQATIDAIIGGAERALVKYGWERTTVQTIADVSGVSVGSLYHHFNSKEDIVIEVFEREMAKPLNVFRDVVATGSGLSFAEAVRLVMRTVVESSKQKPVLRQIMDQEAIKLGMHERLMEIERALRQTARLLFSKYRDESTLTDPDLAVFIVIYAVRYSVRAACDYYHEYLIDDRLADGLSEMIVRYVTGSSAPPPPRRAKASRGP